MRILIKSVIALMMFFSVNITFAEGTWKYYTDCNSIGVIAAHSDYIWCATTSGIVRWNRHDQTYIHEVYSSPDECCWYQANNMIALAVDNEGTAWFGNAYRNYQSWLFSFDGISWTTYTMENSGLPGGVSKLDFDHDGVLWVSTAGGIATFYGDTWTTFTEDGEGNGLIRLLGVDNNNVKWFLTDNGLSSFDGSSWNIYTTENGLPDYDIYNMAVGTDNVKWFTMNSQALVSFDGTTWTVHEGLDWVPLSIAVDTKNRIWCGWKNGLASYDGNNFTYYTTENSGIPDNVIRAIAVDDDGVLWISNAEMSNYGLNRGRGLTRFDGLNWETWSVDGPLSFDILCVYADHNNVKWFGTWWGGLSRFDGKMWKSYSLPDTTTVSSDAQLRVETAIFSIAEDHDYILWLTYSKNYTEYREDSHKKWYDHGVMSFDGITFTDYPDEITGFKPWYSTCIEIDHDNVKWFDTTSFNGSTWTNYKDDGAGHTLSGPVAVDLDNVKWFGAAGGVASFDGSVWEYYAVTGIGNLRQIAVDTRNVKWFQTNGSVTSFDGSMFEHFKLPETKANITDDMAVDRYGFKWFTSDVRPGSGLLCYDGNTWTYYRDDFWLVYAAGRMTIDHDNVKWVVCHSGIACFNGGPQVEPTQVSVIKELPSALSITANYPNPFNPATTIEFSLPKKGFVSLIIYNISGQKVQELVDENLPAGLHHVMWDGTDEYGNAASSGIYISQLTMGKETATGRMVLLR